MRWRKGRSHPEAEMMEEKEEDQTRLDAPAVHHGRQKTMKSRQVKERP